MRTALCEGFDIILKELDERFGGSDGLKLAVKREDVVLEAALQSPTLDLGDLQLRLSFNVEKLKMLLAQLKDFLDVFNASRAEENIDWTEATYSFVRHGLKPCNGVVPLGPRQARACPRF